ncbi:MAG: flagella cluster protein [Salinirussus sp.]
MVGLDIEGGFDPHDYRHGLKLLTETRRTVHFANRNGFACPACDEPFEKLLVSEKRTHRFDPPGGRFCLVRLPDKLLLLTH